MVKEIAIAIQKAIVQCNVIPTSEIIQPCLFVFYIPLCRVMLLQVYNVIALRSSTIITVRKVRKMHIMTR